MTIERITLPGDVSGMNWIRPGERYAQTVRPEGIRADATHEQRGDLLITRIALTNETAKPIFTGLADIAIRLPLEDRYDSADVCLSRRCHAHIYCGLDISYVCALRMGGRPPHFGLVLTAGSLGGYSVERDTARMSNDRGVFLLHPAPMEFAPGETHVIEWAIFAHAGWDDFFKKAGELRRFIDVRADRYVVFPWESACVRIRPSWPAARVTLGGNPVRLGEDGAYAVYIAHSGEPDELELPIEADGVRTRIVLRFIESPMQLAAARCRFIAGHQQYDGPIEGLRGAYLIYDNEDERMHYVARNDMNAGRERVGMGLLMCRMLREHPLPAANEPQTETERMIDALLHEPLFVDDGEPQSIAGMLDEMTGGELTDDERETLRASLERYADFVLRELVDEATGEVYNDFGRDGSYQRLYNFPWYAEFFVELYAITHDARHLNAAVRIIERYYAKGGAAHYPIELPILSLCRALRDAGEGETLARIRGLFTAHGEAIMARGLDYPAHEVNFEQSIVAPAANVLLQLALETGDARFAAAADEQLAILDQFTGHQPHYRLNGVAIRHWDGYWFGKRQRYGDTFPHYWSALTGICHALRRELTGDEADAHPADASLRGVLTLFDADGRGTCAHVFPVTVNGEPGGYDDPYANDQDWALYFWLREAQG